jgi:hypothetical protein
MGRATYDTVVEQLNIGGIGSTEMPVQVRESPTRLSEGGTSVAGGGGASGGCSVSSFFDIWTEISLDGGGSWSPATGPAHVELRPIDPPDPFAIDTLPPLQGVYVSPAMAHATYPAGIVISNITHRRFTQTFPPPPPGGTNVHEFGSEVSMEVSLMGMPFQRVIAPATVSVRIGSMREEGLTRYFDTEMLALNVQPGGELPLPMQIRESPTKVSTGRTQIEGGGAGSGADRISSFFDIFTEVSLDGGQSWQPAESGPVTVTLQPMTRPRIECSREGSDVLFCWPDDGQNWQLYSTPVMSETPSWQLYTGPIEQHGLYRCVRLTAPTQMLFYRLCLDCR